MSHDVHAVYVAGTDEQFSPPETLLGLACVGENVFLEIGSYAEDFDTRHFVADSQITVHIDALLKALHAVGAIDSPGIPDD